MIKVEQKLQQFNSQAKYIQTRKEIPLNYANTTTKFENAKQQNFKDVESAIPVIT